MKTYRDLIVWQKSKDLVIAVYKLTEKFPKEEQFGLTSQMRRSAVSIPSNIAEGKLRGTKPEFKRFLSIAYGSGGELETQLIISKEIFHLDNNEYKDIEILLEEVMKMLNTLIAKA